MASKDSPYSTGFMSANINFDNDTEQMFKQIKREEDDKFAIRGRLDSNDED